MSESKNEQTPREAIWELSGMLEVMARKGRPGAKEALRLALIVRDSFDSSKQAEVVK